MFYYIHIDPFFVSYTLTFAYSNKVDKANIVNLTGCKNTVVLFVIYVEQDIKRNHKSTVINTTYKSRFSMGLSF